MSSFLDTAVSMLLEGDPSVIHAQGLLFGGSLLEGHGRVQKSQILQFMEKNAVASNKLPKYFVRFTTAAQTDTGLTSREPKLGMNIQQHKRYATPQAVYAYGLSETFFKKHFQSGSSTFADDYEFMNVFSVKSGFVKKVLDLQHYSDADLDKDIVSLKTRYPEVGKLGDIKRLNEVVTSLNSLFLDIHQFYFLQI